MTIEEFNALDQDVRQEYVEDNIQNLAWLNEDFDGIIDLPYPHNLIKFIFGKKTEILQPVEKAWDEYVEQRLAKMSEENAALKRDIIDIIFKQHGSAEALAEKYGVIPLTACGMIWKAARILAPMHTSQRNFLFNYIKPVYDEEDFNG